MIALPRRANRDPARKRRAVQGAAGANRDAASANGLLRAAAWAVRLKMVAPATGTRGHFEAVTEKPGLAPDRDSAPPHGALRGAARGVRLSMGVSMPPLHGRAMPFGASQSSAWNADRGSARVRRSRRDATRFGRPAAIIPSPPPNGPMREARAGR